MLLIHALEHFFITARRYASALYAVVPCLSVRPVFSFVGGAILRFFAPQGRHAAPIGVKFGVEESTDDPLLCQIFSPIGSVVGPQKTKNILNFYKILGHKRLSLVYYLHLSLIHI